MELEDPRNLEVFDPQGEGFSVGKLGVDTLKGEGGLTRPVLPFRVNYPNPGLLSSSSNVQLNPELTSKLTENMWAVSQAVEESGKFTVGGKGVRVVFDPKLAANLSQIQPYLDDIDSPEFLERVRKIVDRAGGGDASKISRQINKLAAGLNGPRLGQIIKLGTMNPNFPTKAIHVRDAHALAALGFSALMPVGGASLNQTALRKEKALTRSAAGFGLYNYRGVHSNLFGQNTNEMAATLENATHQILPAMGARASRGGAPFVSEISSARPGSIFESILGKPAALSGTKARSAQKMALGKMTSGIFERTVEGIDSGVRLLPPEIARRIQKPLDSLGPIVASPSFRALKPQEQAAKLVSMIQGFISDGSQEGYREAGNFAKNATARVIESVGVKLRPITPVAQEIKAGGPGVNALVKQLSKIGVIAKGTFPAVALVAALAAGLAVVGRSGDEA